MKLRHLMFAALLAGVAAQPATAQRWGDSARSDMPEENELIRVLSQTFIHGNGANGVPPGVNVSYTVDNVNRCAPRIYLWTGREGSSAAGPGSPKALPMDRVAELVAQGPTQLKVQFNNGSDLVLAANSEAHRRELLSALQAFGNACRNRRS
jgi:hypothetical protein